MFRLNYLLSLIFIYPALAYGLILGTYHTPPYSMYEDDEYIGLATEVVEEILKQAGIVDYQIISYPLARGLLELEHGRVDIFYPYVERNQEKQFKYIGPISRYEVALFANKIFEQKLSLEISDNKMIAVERGSITEELLSDGHKYRLERSTKGINCLKMAIASRVEICALGLLPGLYISALNDMFGDIKYVETELFSDMYLAIGSTVSPEQIEKISIAYEQLKAQDFFEQKQSAYESRFENFIESMT